MRIALIVILVSTCITTSACINMVERVPGVSQEHVEFYYVGHTVVDADSVRAFIRSKTEGCVANRIRECNDLVIAHLFLKQFKEALVLSARLVAKYPKDYDVIITHAATLELNGKVAAAMPFMEQALALNPKSHKGSEWIHLNILRQRLKGAADISPWDLIGMDLRPDSALVKPDTLDAKALAKQVHYQVNDRMFFTPTNDPLFGALLWAYADLLELAGYRSQAKRERERATEYGFTYKWSKPVLQLASTPSDTSASLAAAYSPAEPSPRKQEPGALAQWVAGIFIGAIVLLVVVFVWRNARASR